MNASHFLRVFVAGFTLLPASIGLAVPSVARDDVSQTRAVTGFDRIRLEGAFDVEVTAGASRAHVVIGGAPADVARVTTRVDAGTLIVGEINGHLEGRTLHVAIAVPVLHELKNTGFGNIRISGLTGGDLTLTNSGAASIVAAGKVANLTVTLDGAGKIDATAVAAHDVSADENGLGSIKVRCANALTMNMNGLGEIRYTGNPTHVESHVNGLGRIERM